eukprot:contig_13729_g3304
MLVMSNSPYILTQDPHFSSFLAALTKYTTPAPNTILHHLLELYDCTLSAVRGSIADVKMQYCGLPFAHAVTDLWTEQHSQNSFGSVVVRYVDPKTTTMVVLRLGIGLFVGKHTNDVIMRWFTNRLLYFGLEVTDLASTTTDSGANVRKAMRRPPVPWLPCMSHSLHNSAVYALGGGSASTHQDDLPTTEMSATRSNLLESPSVLMSTLVTPGGAKLFKAVARMLEAPSAYDKAVTALRDTCDRLMEPAPSSPTAAAATGSPRQGTAHAAWTSLPVFTDEDTMDAEVPACSGRAAMAKADVEECLKLVAASKATTPLAFWKENKARFPSLHLVACSVLGAVATSAASERDFSMAANIMRKDRSSMLARHLEMHCLIKDNVHLLPTPLGLTPKLTHAAADKLRADMPCDRQRLSVADNDSSSSDDEDGTGAVDD